MDPLCELEPVAQSLQTTSLDAPDTVEYLPIAQLRQVVLTVAFTVADQEPAEQSVHWVAFLPEYFPATQLSQVSATAYFPASQSTHPLSPIWKMVPSGQPSHLLEPGFAVRVPLHLVHAVAPMVAE